MRPGAQPSAARPPVGNDATSNNRNKRDVNQVKTHHKTIIGPQRNIVGPSVENNSIPTLIRPPRPKSFVLKAGKLLNTVVVDGNSDANAVNTGM